MKFLVTLFLLISGLQSFAERDVFYLVNDSEGWVNVRDYDHKKIIDKLNNNTLTYVFEPNEGDTWFEVGYQKEDSVYYGDIHKSRLIPLSSLKRIPLIKKTESNYTFSNNKITIDIFIKPFNPNRRALEYEETDEFGSQYQILKTIDNKYAWGVDGWIPKIEYKNIDIRLSTGKQFMLPQEALSDLFEADLDSTEVFYDKETDTIYITSLNGDGAGGYNIGWVIENGKYKERLVLHGF